MVTIQFVHYGELDGMSSVGKIRKLLNIAKEDKIVMLQGRLKKEEEAELIQATMEEINKDFKGIELAVIDPQIKDDASAFARFKHGLVNSLLGDRSGMTLIGPASVVKEVKRDPNKIELLTQEKKRKKGKRR